MKNGKKNGIRKTVKKLDTQALMERPCSECGGRVRRKTISQEFEREGIRIKISGFKAWACTRCGEIYFAPGEADSLVQAANSLFALALAGNQHKGKVMAKVS
ncbi:MAG: YgiT-type zinc finger protein [Blastocatellia bacterium]